jgi:hypothetical protein
MPYPQVQYVGPLLSKFLKNYITAFVAMLAQGALQPGIGSFIMREV